MTQLEQEIFINTVLEQFHFLQDTYGYQQISTKVFSNEGAMVRYESSAVWLEIWYDHLRAGELSICMGLIAREGMKITLPYHLFASVSPALEHCLHSLAQRISKEAEPYLLGDTAAYQITMLEQKQRQAQWQHEGRLRRIRAQALAAWQEKNYAQVIASYEEISAELTDTEIKRLALARKYTSS